jgi:hypothetical protein
MFVIMMSGGVNWYARVPTKFNPADDASRLQGESLEEKFKAIKVDCPLPKLPSQYFLQDRFQ